MLVFHVQKYRKGCGLTSIALPDSFTTLVEDSEMVRFWTMLGMVKDVVFSWAFRWQKRRHRAWYIASLALMWVVWRENYKSF